jgi:hypothetical protein
MRTKLFPKLGSEKVAPAGQQWYNFRFQVSGFGCQGVEVIDPET